MNSINAAFFKPPFQGGMVSAGRLLTRANTGIKPPFQFRPEKHPEKGGETPHGYWLQAALPNTTSLRTYPPSGRHTVLT